MSLIYWSTSATLATSPLRTLANPNPRGAAGKTIETNFTRTHLATPQSKVSKITPSVTGGGFIKILTSVIVERSSIAILLALALAFPYTFLEEQDHSLSIRCFICRITSNSGWICYLLTVWKFLKMENHYTCCIMWGIGSQLLSSYYH